MGENGIEDKSRAGSGRARNSWQIHTFEYFYYTGSIALSSHRNVLSASLMTYSHANLYRCNRPDGADSRRFCSILRCSVFPRTLISDFCSMNLM